VKTGVGAGAAAEDELEALPEEPAKRLCQDEGARYGRLRQQLDSSWPFLPQCSQGPVASRVRFVPCLASLLIGVRMMASTCS